MLVLEAGSIYGDLEVFHSLLVAAALAYAVGGGGAGVYPLGTGANTGKAADTAPQIENQSASALQIGWKLILYGVNFLRNTRKGLTRWRRWITIGAVVQGKFAAFYQPKGEGQDETGTFACLCCIGFDSFGSGMGCV